MKEWAKYFQNLLPESVLKWIMLEDLLEVDDKLEEFKWLKYLERDQRLKEIDDLMNGLGGLSNAQKDLGDMERRIMEKGLIAERKFKIREQKILDEKRRQQEAELLKVKSKELREEMIQRHLLELTELQRILEIERKRQIEIHTQQLEKKKNAIEQKKKELQDQVRKQEEELWKKKESEMKKQQEMSEKEKERLKKFTDLCADTLKNEIKLFMMPAYSSEVERLDAATTKGWKSKVEKEKERRR